MRSHPRFERECERTKNRSCSSTSCPASWSLGSYVALFNNKTSCYDINAADVANTRALLRRCVPYYLQWANGTCSDDAARCQSEPPEECVNEQRGATDGYDVAFGGTPIGAVYTIFHFLASADFATEISKNLDAKLTYVSHIVPIEFQRDKDGLTAIYLDRFHEKIYRKDTVVLKAIDFDIKFDLFEIFLFGDMLYIGLGLLAVFVVLWIYTRSVLITLAACLNFVLSLLLSYFCYMVIFQKPFFPFVNIAAAVLVIGVGADDTFVYVDLWRDSLKEHSDAELHVKVQSTLRHATITMFVTSLSTAGSLYASIISNITAIKCFGLFAGTAILMNFLLTLSLLPAVIILDYRFWTWKEKGKKDDEDEESCRSKCAGIYQKGLVLLELLFSKHLPALVMSKLRFLWIILFSVLGVVGTVVVFKFPGLQLPSSSEFQILREANYLEQWDTVYRDMFAFATDDRERMSVYILFGVTPTDSGNVWDPEQEDSGAFRLDTSFTFATAAHQEWMMAFCRELKEQDFYHDVEYGTACFMEALVSYMDRPCIDSYYGNDYSPCCNNSVFPYDASVFDTCLKACAGDYAKDCSGGVRFSTEDDRFAAISIEFQSSTFVTYDYEIMQKYWSDLNGWVQTKVASAPESLKNGWAISQGGAQLYFVDLQDSLASGTPGALGITLIVMLIIILCTIQNVVLALIAIVTVGFAVFVTIGSLVLLGWELNIFESIILTLSVGLCVDFTLHYGVAYKLAPFPDRLRRTEYSLKTMSAAISIAALSTFLAGLFMLLANVNAYLQLGSFLLLVMTISWIYSTLFFQSLCRVMGPSGNVGSLVHYWGLIFGKKCQGETHVQEPMTPMAPMALKKSNEIMPDAPPNESIPLAPEKSDEIMPDAPPNESIPLTNTGVVNKEDAGS